MNDAPLALPEAHPGVPQAPIAEEPSAGRRNRLCRGEERTPARPAPLATTSGNGPAVPCAASRKVVLLRRRGARARRDCCLQAEGWDFGFGQRPFRPSTRMPAGAGGRQFPHRYGREGLTASMWPPREPARLAALSAENPWGNRLPNSTLSRTPYSLGVRQRRVASTVGPFDNRLGVDVDFLCRRMTTTARNPGVGPCSDQMCTSEALATSSRSSGLGIGHAAAFARSHPGYPQRQLLCVRRERTRIVNGFIGDVRL